MSTGKKTMEGPLCDRQAVQPALQGLANGLQPQPAVATAGQAVAMTGTTGLDAGNTAASEKGRDVEVAVASSATTASNVTVEFSSSSAAAVLSEDDQLAITLDDLAYRSLLLGFGFLTIGIVSGAVWANEAWGNYWSWDPKESDILDLYGFVIQCAEDLVTGDLGLDHLVGLCWILAHKAATWLGHQGEREDRSIRLLGGLGLLHWCQLDGHRSAFLRIFPEMNGLRCKHSKQPPGVFQLAASLACRLSAESVGIPLFKFTGTVESQLMEPEPELEREPLPSSTEKDVQDAYNSWETKSKDDKMNFLLSIPMRKDSNLKKNEAAMRAILVKAETDTDEWVQRLALLLGSVVGTTTVSSSEVDKQFIWQLSREVRQVRVRDNALIDEVSEFVTPCEEEEEFYRRQCSSPLAPALLRDAEQIRDPEEAIAKTMAEAQKQLVRVSANDPTEQSESLKFQDALRALDEQEEKERLEAEKRQSAEEHEAKRQRTDPFQSFGEVSRQRTSVKASSSSGGDGLGAYNMDTFTSADVREKLKKDRTT
eukprot:symbB.v1.2.004806.t1/scaffold270.1/size246978/17